MIMSFIDKVIGPDEKLVGVSAIHWIYAAIGIFWMAGFLILGLYLDSWGIVPVIYYPGNPGVIATSIMGHTAFWVCTLLGVLLFLLYFIMMVTTEIGLTNKRIIYKRGWIFVKVSEADLEEMKAAGVNNGILGRLLNYGYIQLDARFIDNLNIPAIADPYRFVKAVNEIRSNLRQDSMTVVLEGHGENKVVDEENKKVAVVPEPKQKVHKLEDPRYEAISNDPAQNIAAIKEEIRENNARRAAEQAIPAPLAPPSETEQKMAPHPATPPSPEFIEQATGQAAPAAPQQQTPAQAGNNASGPTVFEKESHKEELKEHILENFSDTVHKKSA